MKKTTKPTQKLTKTKEYRPPTSIAMERTFEFYGDQRMSLGEGPVRTTAGQLTKAMLNDAAVRLKQRQLKNGMIEEPKRSYKYEHHN